MDNRLQTELQNFLNQVDSGFGSMVIRWLLLAFFAFSSAALCVYMGFQGLRSAPAMESAQLARNIAEGRGFVTRCIRPVVLGRLAGQWPAPPASEFPDSEAAPPQPAPVDIDAIPDLTTPPLHPWLLAAAFRLSGIPATGEKIEARAYPWDYVPVILDSLCLALCILWIVGIGKRLFNLRCAVLAASSWLLSAPVWTEALAGDGTGLAVFLVLGACWGAVRSVEAPRTVSRILFLVLSALLTAAAFHVRYTAAFFVLPLFLFFGFASPSRPWAGAVAYLLLAAAACIPWIVRNLVLCGAPFGLAPCAMLAGTYLFPGDIFERTIAPSLLNFPALREAVAVKMIANLRNAAPLAYGFGAFGLPAALFCAQFLHRFHRPSSARLRLCILPAFPLLLLAAATLADPDDPQALRHALLPLYPLVLLYAWAFALTLLDRLPFANPLPARLAVAALLLLGAVPYVFQVLPPRSGLPYPPYYHNHIAWTASLVEPAETLVTDIPWATAWYGGKNSVLVPRDLDSLYRIHRDYAPLSLAYFTMATRNKPWIRGLVDADAPDHDWYRIFSERYVPRDFPFPDARIFFGDDQMILADRPRW